MKISSFNILNNKKKETTKNINTKNSVIETIRYGFWLSIFGILASGCTEEEDKKNVDPNDNKPPEIVQPDGDNLDGDNEDLIDSDPGVDEFEDYTGYEDIVLQKMVRGVKENSSTQELSNSITGSGDIDFDLTDVTTTITGVDQEEVNRLKGELSTIETNITSKNNQLSIAQTALNNFQAQLTTSKNDVNTTYNSLDSNGQTLINPSSSSNEKNTAVSNVAEGIVPASYSKSGTKSIASLNINTDGPTIQEGSTLLKNKISSLENEIKPLKDDLNNKKRIYEDKYDEYLDAKEAYEEDQALAKEAYAKYNNLKSEVDTLEDEVKTLLNKKNLLSDQIAQLEKPKSSDYSVSTTVYSNYAGVNSISDLKFTYRGEQVRGYFELPSTGKFSGKIWLEINGKKGGDYTVKNPNHLSDIVEYLEEAIKLQIDYEYYSDEYEDEKDRLDDLIDEKDEAYFDTFVYGLIASAEKEMYEAEKDDYNDAKDDYNYAYAILQPKLTRLGDLKQKLSDLLSGVIGLEDIEYDVNESTSEVNILSGEVDNLNIEKENKVVVLELAESGTQRDVINTYATKAQETITVGTKTFTMTVGSSLEDKKTLDELNLILEDRMSKVQDTQHIEDFEYKGEIVTLTNRVIYYINGETKYPALMWGEYNAFGIHRESKVYKINESYSGEGDAVKEDIGNQLENSVLNIGTYDSFENLLPDESDGLCMYKGVVHYDYNNTGEDYPAKVGVHYKIGNHEYFEYSDELVYDDDEKDEIAQKLIANLRNSIKVSSNSGMNKGEQVYRNGESFVMDGGAYNIYEVPNGYVATYVVELGGNWHTSVVWNNEEVLKTEVERIINKWFTDNQGTSIIDDTGDEIIPEIEAEEVLYDLSNDLDLDELKEEYNRLYSELEQSCIIEANNNIQLSGDGALDLRGTDRVEYISSCVDREENMQELRKIFKNTIELHKESIIGSIETVDGFKDGYGQAIYDTANFITNLNQEQLKNIGINIFNSSVDVKNYFDNIGKYWGASINYSITKHEKFLNEKNELESKISLAPEMIELENLISEIDWENVEDVNYWTGYIGGYLTENMIVGFGASKVSKFGITKIKNTINKIKLGSTTVNAFKNITKIDDILEISNLNKLPITNPTGKSYLVSGGNESAEAVINKLKNNGWKLIDDIDVVKGNIKVYESLDGIEKINYRNFDSSEGWGLYEGYKHNKTIDLFKNGNKIQGKNEIKFLTIKK